MGKCLLEKTEASGSQPRSDPAILSNSSRDRSLRCNVTYRPPVSSLKTRVPKPARRWPASSNNRHFLHVTANAVDFSWRPHAFGDGVSRCPKIDDLAADAQARRLLDQGSLEAGHLKSERVLVWLFPHLKSALSVDASRRARGIASGCRWTAVPPSSRP